MYIYFQTQNVAKTILENFIMFMHQIFIEDGQTNNNNNNNKNHWVMCAIS